MTTIDEVSHDAESFANGDSSFHHNLDFEYSADERFGMESTPQGFITDSLSTSSRSSGRNFQMPAERDFLAEISRQRLNPQSTDTCDPQVMI